MKNLTILTIAFCVLVLAGYSFPLAKKVSNLKKENITLTSQLKSKEELRESLKEAQKELAQTSIEKKIPFSVDQENLLRDLIKILKKSNFSFESFNFSLGKQQHLNSKQVLVNTQIKGLKNNLKTLLSYIEQNERFLGMENLTFSIQEKKGLKTTSMSLSIYALFQE